MIKAEELCKVFSKLDEKKKSYDFYAVNHVSLETAPGEILGILGPNGAGKTTLLRMLGNLMQPTSGKVSVWDEKHNEITDPVIIKGRLGYLSGNTKLYHRFSTREILNMIGDIHGISKEEKESRITEICEILKMDSFVDNKIGRLSTGQTQRANIARCLIHHPDIYIFDEPTLGLDIISSESIIEFMKKEREKGKTVIYSTHYMEEAQYLCNRILMIHQGKIIAQGTPTQLMEQTKTNNLRDTFRELLTQSGGDMDE